MEGNDNVRFVNRENAPGVTCWSRRGRFGYSLMPRHFSRARCAAQ